MIESGIDLPREELTRISNYVNQRFAGRSMRQIRKRLLELMAEERAQVDELLSNALELSNRALEADLHLSGEGLVLNRVRSIPHGTHLEVVAAGVQVLEEQPPVRRGPSGEPRRHALQATALKRRDAVTGYDPGGFADE